MYGLWRSLVSALVWGTKGPGFKSRQPDKQCGERGRWYSRWHGHRQCRWALRAGQIATAYGILPTVMGGDTAPVAVVITDTVPSTPLVT